MPLRAEGRFNRSSHIIIIKEKRNLLFWYTGVIWRGLNGQKLVQLVHSNPEILLKCARMLKNVNKTEKQLNYFCQEILMIISSRGWSNVDLFKLEKLFGLVLALVIPETAERMNWTNFTNWKGVLTTCTKGGCRRLKKGILTDVGRRWMSAFGFCRQKP